MQALGQLAAIIPEDMRPAFITGLLAKLKDEDGSIRRAAVQALGQLAAIIPKDMYPAVITGHLENLKDEDGDVPQATEGSLVQLTAIIPKDMRPSVIKGLLGYWGICRAGVQALGQLAAIIPEDMRPAVITGLLERLKYRDRRIRQAAAQALGQLAAIIPESQHEIVIITLIKKLQDNDKNVYDASAQALVKLSQSISDYFPIILSQLFFDKISLQKLFTDHPLAAGIEIEKLVNIAHSSPTQAHNLGYYLLLREKLKNTEELNETSQKDLSRFFYLTALLENPVLFQVTAAALLTLSQVLVNGRNLIWQWAEFSAASIIKNDQREVFLQTFKTVFAEGVKLKMPLQELSLPQHVPS